jgi:hypothetical protein
MFFGIPSKTYKTIKNTSRYSDHWHAQLWALQPASPSYGYKRKHQLRWFGRVQYKLFTDGDHSHLLDQCPCGSRWYWRSCGDPYEYPSRRDCTLGIQSIDADSRSVERRWFYFRSPFVDCHAAMTWAFTTQNAGGRTRAIFSFSANGNAVPDGGSAVAFLGLALTGLEVLRRKLKRD